MNTKECIACAEQINENAKLCRFCKTDQSDSRYCKKPKHPIQTASKKIASNISKSPTAICTKCGIYVVESEYFDTCEVCRGQSKTGKLPSKFLAVSTQVDEGQPQNSNSLGSRGNAGIWMVLGLIALIVGMVFAGNINLGGQGSSQNNDSNFNETETNNGSDSSTGGATGGTDFGGLPFYDLGFSQMQAALSAGLTPAVIDIQYGGPESFCYVQSTHRMMDTTTDTTSLGQYKDGCIAAIAAAR